MTGTAYESRVRLPSGSAVLVRIEVAEDDAYDDQGELAEVAQMVASTTLTVLKTHIEPTPREALDPWGPGPWGPAQPDPFLTTDITGTTETRAQKYPGDLTVTREDVGEPPC